MELRLQIPWTNKPDVQDCHVLGDTNCQMQGDAARCVSHLQISAIELEKRSHVQPVSTVRLRGCDVTVGRHRCLRRTFIALHVTACPFTHDVCRWLKHPAYSSGGCRGLLMLCRDPNHELYANTQAVEFLLCND